MRQTIGLMATEDRCILLANKRGWWIFPGGKPEEGESEKKCLRREIAEELPGMEIAKLTRVGVVNGISPITHIDIQLVVYCGKIVGPLRPSAEIQEARWVPLSQICEYELSDLTKEAISRFCHPIEVVGKSGA